MAAVKDDKEVRYDRQRRLWGDSGQSYIETAKIILLNANATGAEILKNLVLPGIGNFTVVDGEKVTARDLGNNFFVTQSSLGASRAKTVTALLQELNPYAKGDYVEEDPRSLIDNKPDYFNNYTLVIASNMDEQHVRALGKICYDRDIPLIIARSYGLIGYIRIVTKEHEIVESKLDNPVDCLRVNNPWPELLQFCESQDLSKMSPTEHSHTPWLAILIQFLQKWKASHDGKEPITRADKEEFKKQITDAMQEPHEPNFVEALNSSFKAWAKGGVPYAVQHILNDEKCANLNEKSTAFWVIANAVKQFVDNEGKGELPVAGSIPDMQADTTRYIKLQQLFNEKAEADARVVKKYVEENLKRLNRNENEISFDLVRAFCKNAHNIRLVRYRSLEQEYTPETANTQEISAALEDPMNTVVFYLLLRACDRFYRIHHHYPGEKLGHDIESDVTELKNVLTSLLSELNMPNTNIPDEYIQEMVRYGAAELHNIAALVGGATAQEVIKLVTRQRVPLDNTWIFCGINSSANSFKA
eukprot:GEZU01036124.1.p1 GENE.GEZU01036124.1~~GEZU01036124.1.p1  ORF type:complete len:551 (+),score=208.96 GEZU01036124.1:66-1655(+)